jgi:melanoma-associated antigen
MIVLGAHARSFRRVFDAAQEQLQRVFGMEMAELPVRERRTLKDKQSKSEVARCIDSYGFSVLIPPIYSG